ncbi:MAG: hypothetical protein WA688_07440 [Thermoplasmata archaeon]
MVRPKVDPSAKQINVTIVFNRKGLVGKTAWDSGFVTLNAHPQFGIKAQKSKPFDNPGQILSKIIESLSDAGVELMSE